MAYLKLSPERVRDAKAWLNAERLIRLNHARGRAGIAAITMDEAITLLASIDASHVSSIKEMIG